MFPDLNLDEVVEETLEEEEKQGITYLYDFEKGDFVLENGKLVEVEGKEAVKVWIEKILKTEEFKFDIYENDSEEEYGATIRKLILGKRLPQLLLKSELKRIVTEKLTQHSEIEDVTDFETEQKGATLTTSFTVVLKDDTELEHKVVI